MTLREVIRERIRREGPLPFAAYAEFALYHSELGYYARADRRSGRAGDFFTSVDLGPAFGGLLASQLAEMWRLLGAPSGEAASTWWRRRPAAAVSPATCWTPSRNATRPSTGPSACIWSSGAPPPAPPSRPRSVAMP